MEVLIKWLLKNLQSGGNVFHSNVKMARNTAEKTAVIKKLLCSILICYLKKKKPKQHNFKMFNHLNYFPSTDSEQYSFTFLIISVKIILFEYFTLLERFLALS